MAIYRNYGTTLKKSLSIASLCVLAASSALGFGETISVSEDDNLIDQRIFDPPSFGNLRMQRFYLWDQWMERQKDVYVKDKTIFSKTTKKTKGLNLRFYCDYEVTDKLKVSFEYKYNGTQPLRVNIAYSGFPKIIAYNHTLPPAADFTKAEFDFKFETGAYLGQFGVWLEKDTEFAIRNLKIKAVDYKPSGGKPVILDGQKCEVIYYSGKNAIEEHYNRFAGKVLRSSLYKAGTELLPLKKYNGESLKNAILIQSPGKAGEVPAGGFRLQIKNGGAVVTGARPGGADAGVLALWEKLGIRYFIPEEAVVLKPEFKAATTDETITIGISFRNSNDRHWHEERIGFSQRSTERANYRYNGGDTSHPLESFLSEAEFAKTHPEYFALQADGSRGKIKVLGHLCTTNPDVIRIVSERMMEVISKQPEAQYFPMFWGDGGNFACRCENCKKVGLENLNLKFVNEIAKRVAKKYPNVKLTTLAYVMTRQPPTGGLRPEPNVIIQYAPYAPAHMNSHQWVHHSNQMCLDDLKVWEKLQPNGMGAFIYPCSCRENFNIWPAYQCNVDQVKHFSKKHYKIIETCEIPKDNASIPNSNNFYDLNLYMIGRISMYPDTDVKKETALFMKHYYGPAGKEMGAYLDLILNEVKKKDWGHNTEYVQRGFVTHELAKKAYAIFAEAEKKTAGNPLYYGRVRSEKKYLLWTDLTDNNRVNGKVTEKDLPAYAEKLAEFCRICKEEKVSHMHGGNPEKWFWENALLKIENIGKAFYDRPMVVKFMADPLKTLQTALPQGQEKKDYGYLIPSSGMLGGERIKTKWFRANAIDAIQLKRPSSGYGMTKFLLNLSDAPKNTVQMKVNGIDCEKTQTTQMEVLVNGKSVFKGNVPWKKDKWSLENFTIPAGLLVKGDNEIMFQNITEDTEKDGVGGVAFAATRNYFWGWYIIAEAEIHLK